MLQRLGDALYKALSKPNPANVLPAQNAVTAINGQLGPLLHSYEKAIAELKAEVERLKPKP